MHKTFFCHTDDASINKTLSSASHIRKDPYHGNNYLADDIFVNLLSSVGEV